MCGSQGTEGTADLIDLIDGTVFTAGDNAYFQGTAHQYRQCYDPTWGRHKGRTRPAPGNHEYETAGASAYFDYFGDRAGPRGLGYYSFNGRALARRVDEQQRAGRGRVPAAAVAARRSRRHQRALRGGDLAPPVVLVRARTVRSR